MPFHIRTSRSKTHTVFRMHPLLLHTNQMFPFWQKRFKRGFCLFVCFHMKQTQLKTLTAPAKRKRRSLDSCEQDDCQLQGTETNSFRKYCCRQTALLMSLSPGFHSPLTINAEEPEHSFPLLLGGPAIRKDLLGRKRWTKYFHITNLDFTTPKLTSGNTRTELLCQRKSWWPPPPANRKLSLSDLHLISQTCSPTRLQTSQDAFTVWSANYTTAQSVCKDLLDTQLGLRASFFFFLAVITALADTRVFVTSAHHQQGFCFPS